MNLRSFLACTTFVGAVLSTGSAYARPEYHEDVVEASGGCVYKMCIACHFDVEGGGVWTQPFFRAMVSNGFDYSDGSTAVPAFEALRNAGTDSDMDGISDALEFENGSNPNSADDVTNYCEQDLKYGCFAARVAKPAPRYAMYVGALAILFGMLGLQWRRMRRRAS